MVASVVCRARLSDRRRVHSCDRSPVLGSDPVLTLQAQHPVPWGYIRLGLHGLRQASGRRTRPPAHQDAHQMVSLRCKATMCAFAPSGLHIAVYAPCWPVAFVHDHTVPPVLSSRTRLVLHSTSNAPMHVAPPLQRGHCKAVPVTDSLLMMRSCRCCADVCWVPGHWQHRAECSIVHAGGGGVARVLRPQVVVEHCAFHAVHCRAAWQCCCSTIKT